MPQAQMVSILFSSGSVIVTYQISIHNDTTDEQLEAIFDAFVQAANDGTFGGNFALDAESIRVDTCK